MVRLMSCGFAVFLGMLIVFGSRIAAQGPAAKAAIPAYNLQEIPKQIFADGGILQFRIQDLAGARVSVTSDPQPQGALAVDANGVFTFSPTQYDAGNFYISFQKQNPGSAAPTKQVTISVFGNLAPEYTLVSKGRKQPDEASLQYITKTETEEPVHRAFNYRADQKVMDVVISGKTVVLDSAADSNNLMHQIGNRTDIGSLSIYAQTLMIKSGLVVPAANVHIYARQLLFDDGNAPAGTAFIATTPLTDKFAPEIGANGLPGLAAGSVSVNVEKFVRPPGNMPRFIISGGDGQNAGLGQSKVPGSSMPCYKGISLNGTCVVHIHQFAGPTSFGADNTWPQSGDDATKPGAPGPGGPPGDFVSNVSGWAPFIKADPGKPGAMAQHVDGGPAGQPIHALNVEIREQNGRGGLSPGPCPDDRFQLPKQCKVRVGPAWFQLLSVESESYTHPGKSFDPPTAPAVTYPPSNISVSGISDAWLQPAILRAVLNHAEDAYIDGAVDYTASVLQDFGALVDKKLADWDADSAARKARNEAALSQPLSALPAEIRQQIDFIWDPSQPNAQGTLRAAVQRVIDQQEDDHNSFVQTQLEIASIATRIAHNLDYFDHPAGWVPQLSLAYTLQAYNNEVKNDLPILYLAYYISQSSADKERHLKSLTELQSNLSADVSTLTDKVNNAQVEMLKLENQAQQIDGDISLEEQDVNNRLITLTQQAQKIVDERDSVPFWKSCVKVLSVAASVCPVGQPMVGAVGVGLNALSDAGQQGVGETLQQLGDVAGDFSKENIHKSVEQYHAQLAKLDPSNAKNTVDYVKGLVPMAQGIAKEYQAINSSLQTHKASSDEVNKELAQLEASDAEFTQDSEKMKDLNSRKQLFEDQLGQEMDETAKNMDNIQSDWQAIDSTNRAIENFSAAIDHEAVQQVQLFGRRTRDRLLRYQYYLAKAYEYRLLKPYPGDFHLDKLLDALTTMTAPTEDHDATFKVMSDDQFNELGKVYAESIQEVISEANSLFQERPKPQEATTDVIFSDDQLKTLNGQNLLTLDLGQAIGQLLSEDNRRLVDINVTASMNTPSGVTISPIRISFEHSGASVLRSEKNSYRFVHRAVDGDASYTWSGNLEPGNRWDEDTISPEYIALLKMLQSVNAKPGDPEVDLNGLFALPGLDGPILIRRQLGIGEPITALTLHVKYVFDPAKEREYPISVTALDGIEPLIDVDKYDNSGRTLGQGTFTRYYPLGVDVTLKAPSKFGNRSFSAWIVDGVTKNTPQITLTTDNVHVAQLKYGPPSQ